MKREFFVSDLDGTLLDSDARLSDFARGAIERLLDAGVLFTVASARSVQSMRPILGDLPLRLPVVAMNGAFLSDLRTGRHERVASIPEASIAPMLRAALDLGLEPFVTSFDGERDNLYIPEPRHDGLRWYLDERRAIRDPRLRDDYAARNWLGERIITLTFIDAKEKLEPLLEVVERNNPAVGAVFTRHIYTTGWYWLTVHSGEASKDKAVEELRRRHGLMDARVVAFGDQGNDVALLRYADHAVAVANADDEVKAVAAEVIGRNAEDAVPRYVLRRTGV